MTQDDFLSTPGFVEFTALNFDPSAYAHELLGKQASLQYNLELIKKKINDKGTLILRVITSHDQLLDSVKDLKYMETVVKDVTQHCAFLQQKYQKYFILIRLRMQISEPFKEMQQSSERIKELGQTSDSLRDISRFLVVCGRLEALVQDEDEYPRAATYLYEIARDLESLEFCKDEYLMAKGFGSKLRVKGHEWIETGVTENNQQLLSRGLYIFINLRCIKETVLDLLKQYQSNLSLETGNAFDITALNQELKETMQKSQTSSKENIAAWANLLWSRIEKLTDSIYLHSSKVQVLQSFLARQKDNFTQESLLVPITKALDGYSLKLQFWTVLSHNLELDIKKATKGNTSCDSASQFLMQVLQAGYPKLLRIFVDLFAKLDLQASPDDQKNIESTALMKSLSQFEAAYVSRVLSRMLESVGTIIPEKSAARVNPSTEEANKLVKSLASELNAVKFDDHLLKSVGKNLAKALNLFKGRILSTLNMEASFTITGTQPGTMQMQKIHAINCFYALSENLWDLMEEYSGSVIEDFLYDGSKLAIESCINIVERILLDLINELEPVMKKMHIEDYIGLKPTSRTSVSTSTSQYTAEYTAKIRWIFREFFSKLACKNYISEWALLLSKRILSLHLSHSSLLKTKPPYTSKIIEDLNLLHYTLSQSLSLLTPQVDESLYEELYAFKMLFDTDLALINKKLPIRPSLLLNHIIARSDDIIPPRLYYGWNELEYIKWIDTHTEKDQRMVFKSVSESYLGRVEASGKTETCLEHPVFRTVLLDWETSE